MPIPSPYFVLFVLLSIHLGATDIESSTAAEELAKESDSVSVSRLQLIGTHNSYHIVPDDVALRLMGAFSRAAVQANNYSHRPLREQLDTLKIRQFELDLYVDRKGGKFASPATLEIAEQEGSEVPFYDKEVMKKPGIKILHSVEFDFRSHHQTLRNALRELNDWSSSNREHVPIFILLELKDETFSPRLRPDKWNRDDLIGLEKEILAELPLDRILTPSKVKGNAKTLRERILKEGWPTLGESRGKFVFLLDNESGPLKDYMQMHPDLQDALIFPSLNQDHPCAAFLKRNDPIRSFSEIKELVSSGFLVRTRADAELQPLYSNSTEQRDKAIASGAQLISTDFPEPRTEQGYFVQFQEGKTVQVRQDSDKD